MKLKITLVRSPIGQKPNTRKTVEALGLRKLHHFVIQKDTPPILGMIKTVAHLVEVEEIKGRGSK
ncbi:MAG: 50S ribosomal protein L30 [Candidatus Celaenobacter antarcticus]|nr:50S ribosomal protein L30 [Candidatus Celaenobacter antarcticus]MDP8315699.1 50S ribosomal protein L30 [Candidatus Celaenobacter antarcticus]